jgi:glycosyltransferase involved in cell wall biosynthesis
MDRAKIENKILMVGPDVAGLGGISRVVNIWQHNEFFSDFNISYISSTRENARFKTIFSFFSFLQYLIRLIKDTSVIYVHTSSYNSFRRKLPFLIAALLLNKKVVLHIHPTHFYKYLCAIKGLEKKIVFNTIDRIRYFVVLTHGMKSKLKNLFSKKSIFVLPNAVDISRMQLKRAFKRESNSFLYLGWYIKEKGVYDLVDAADLLLKRGKTIQIRFYGTKEIHNLREYVHKKGLNNHLAINDWIDGNKKLELLHSCTALILPSHSEGIPNVILEAMATKTPIISTDVGGLKSVLRTMENSIIVKPQDINDISEKIELCLLNERLRAKISFNAYHDAVDKYDIHVIRKDFKRILKRIIVSI